MENQDKQSMHQKTITIDISPDIEKGTYSNQLIVGHSQKEFILDFGVLLPPGQKIKIVSRIVVNPVDAKALLMALNENITRYEKIYGTIQIPIMTKNPSADKSVH